MANKPNLQTLAAENRDLRARLERSEGSLREILSGELDALYVRGVGGAQVFTLKGADQSYRTLIENMNEGALTLTPDGLVLYANRRFAEMLRTPLEKVIGSDIHTWFAPESRLVLQTLLRKAAGENRREELALAATDGTLVPVYLSVSHHLLDETPDSLCMVATDLTEQKRNEAIVAAEKLARAILEQAADAIVICDETGRIIRASKQAQAFYGKDLLEQHFERAFPLRQLDGAAFSPIGAIDTSRRQSMEAKLERNGKEFDFLVNVGHLKGAGNKLLGSVVTLTDITDRKKAEQKFKGLLECAPDAMVIVSPSGDIVLVNSETINLFGWLREELLGHKIEILIPKRFRGNHSRNRDGFVAESRARAMGANETLELVALRKDGAEFPAEISLSPLKTDEGTLVIAAIRDITVRKQAEQALRESERRFSELLGNVELVSVMRDCKGQITYCNEYLLHLTNWHHDEVIGRNWAELFIPPEIIEEKRLLFAALLENAPEARHHENEILTRSGERRLIHWNNSVLRSGAGDVVGTASIGEDITERKQSETSIKRLNRVYAVLSGVNALIVRVRDRDELFKEACRIAVEDGQFQMAWIGVVDRSAMTIVQAASGGIDAGYASVLDEACDRMALDDGAPAGYGPQAIAVREKQPVVVNDVASDPRSYCRREHADRGTHSLVCLPLLVANEPVAVFTLHAGQVGYFDEAEMKLLMELAGDIAFAIDNLDKRERIAYLAYYDVLTGLANRSLFLERVAQYVRSAASGGHKLAFFLIDLERFKNINDSLGRAAGDELLRQVANWLIRLAGDANLVARVDADIFAIVLPEVRPGGNLEGMLEKMIESSLEHPFRLNDAVFRVAAKIGVALFPGDGADDADALFRNAEAALKKAKARGERYLFHTNEMTEAVAGNLSLETQLREALDKQQFVLHYQPKVSVASGKITSAEALIRWNDPRTGLVPPNRFIPILEEIGLIYDVGRWALRQAIADYVRWRTAGLPAVRIAVNVSPLQLRNRGFIDEIRQVIGIDAHAAEGLELEITESLIMENVKQNIASLNAIRALGVPIAIDDFGTGFSSLSYLAKLPVDTIKIDRSFVNDMVAGPEGLALVSTIINLAHSLKLKVVAEGVETEEQLRLLRLLNCDEMQGFLFSKAVSSQIFEKLFLASLPPA
jgi:diguanylate cyclase (GGDEF)-like protein/PAS domain S-box-containing protein